MADKIQDAIERLPLLFPPNLAKCVLTAFEQAQHVGLEGDPQVRATADEILAMPLPGSGIRTADEEKAVSAVRDAGWVPPEVLAVAVAALQEVLKRHHADSDDTCPLCAPDGGDPLAWPCDTAFDARKALREITGAASGLLDTATPTPKEELDTSIGGAADRSYFAGLRERMARRDPVSSPVSLGGGQDGES